MRHEKALDSEWEGTEHDKRKEEKDMTNIRQKEKRVEERPNPEREVNMKDRANLGGAFLGREISFWI